MDAYEYGLATGKVARGETSVVCLRPPPPKAVQDIQGVLERAPSHARVYHHV